MFYVSTGGFTSTGSACGTSCHYLEARAFAGKAEWCFHFSQLVAGTFGTAIGTGFSNTTLMSNSPYCATGASASATVASGGYSDWFLPSKDEGWVLLNVARGWAISDSGGMGFYGDAWSSSQADATVAWAGDLIFGKNNKLKVLPVRAF